MRDDNKKRKPYRRRQRTCPVPSHKTRSLIDEAVSYTALYAIPTSEFTRSSRLHFMLNQCEGNLHHTKVARTVEQ